MRVAYFYSLKDDPAVRDVAPKHAAYWQGLDLEGYIGGPFTDRSGGLISFEVESLDRARELVDDDPFCEANLLAECSVKEWAVE